MPIKNRRRARTRSRELSGIRKSEAAYSHLPGPGGLPANRSRPESSSALTGVSSLILQSLGEGICDLDANGITTFINPAAEAMTGWTAEELRDKPLHDILHHSHADGSKYPLHDCPVYVSLREGRTHRSDSEVFWRKDGTSFPVAYTSTPILREERLVGAVILFQDISERKRREKWEKDKNEIFLAITRNLHLETTLAMIGDAFIVLCPPRAVAFFVCADSGLRLVAQSGFKTGTQNAIPPSVYASLLKLCLRAVELGKASLIERGSDDERGMLADTAFCSCLATPLFSGSGQILGAMAVFDLGSVASGRTHEPVDSICDLVQLAIEHHQLQAKLVHQTQYDYLTGLLNRSLLEDRLELAVLQAKRRGRHVGICFVDLDRFKQVNDALGHGAGDIFLQHVAGVLARNVREVDTVARQGGDEFILVLPDLALEAEAEEICERVLSSLRERVTIGKHTLSPSASIGISMYPADGEAGSVLLQRADTALYAAKRAGKDRIRRYENHLGAKIQRDIELQSALRFALERKQLSVVYQPLYSRGRELRGFEALLRWNHPELGSISPVQFIPMAEETGLIVALGEWVLDQACRQACEWNLVSPAPVRMFVNVSGVQLAWPEFTSSVARILSQSGFPARLLELEVTESWIVTEPEAAILQLEKLRTLGVSIGVDDFGTGQSSLSILQKLPIDTLKIDKSFIARLDGTAKGSAIIRTIVTLAQQLCLQTVAEGVETHQQLEDLQATQCNLLQGYIFAKPLQPEAAVLLLPPKPAAVCQPSRAYSSALNL